MKDNSAVSKVLMNIHLHVAVYSAAYLHVPVFITNIYENCKLEQFP